MAGQWRLSDPLHLAFRPWTTLGDLLAGRLGELDAPVPSTTAPFLADAGTAANAAATDFTDELIEDLLRSIGGPAVWLAMKDNARRASESGGGAAYMAATLQAYLEVESATIHAAGFSAGANFHRYFVPAVVRDGSASFETCGLLVPSLCTEWFNAGLAPLQGTGIKSLALFGMQEELALADNVFGLYRKSLLSLIKGTLNPTPGTPLVGLQESVVQDPELNAMFKIPPDTGLVEAVWSVATSGPLDSRSAATTHTAFDDDVPTMDSVVRRVVGRDNIISYGTTKHAAVLASAAGEVLRRP